MKNPVVFYLLLVLLQVSWAQEAEHYLKLPPTSPDVFAQKVFLPQLNKEISLSRKHVNKGDTLLILLDSIHHSPGMNGGWNAFTYNEKGLQTKMYFFIQAFVGDNAGYFSFEYTPFDAVKKRSYFSTDATKRPTMAQLDASSTWQETIDYTYNSYNLLESVTNIIIYAGPRTRYLYTYDERKNLIQVKLQEYKNDFYDYFVRKTWFNEYDEDTLSHLYDTYDYTGIHFSEKTFNKFDYLHQQIAKLVYKVNWYDSTKITPYQAFAYEYDQFGNINREEEHRYGNPNTWTFRQFSYRGKDLPDTVLIKHGYDSITLQIEKWVYTYDDTTGWLMDYRIYWWNKNAAAWEVQYREIYDYDSIGNKVRERWYDYVSGYPQLYYYGVYFYSYHSVTLPEIPADEDSSNISLPLSIFPNPSNGFIHISGIQDISGTVFLKIYDFQGRNCGDYQLTAINDIPVDLSHLQPGLYFITLENTQGLIHTAKLIRR